MELDLRFEDEYDYEYEIFSIPSRARVWASVILAGKRDSRRHSTTWYSKNRDLKIQDGSEDDGRPELFSHKKHAH